MTRFFFATALSLALLSSAEAALRKRAKPPVADQIITSTIDVPKTVEGRTRIPTGSQIEIAFAPKPQRQAERLVIKVIEAADTSVFMAAYSMTSKPIADAMCRAAARGVAVSAVLDAKSNPHGNGWSSSKRDYMSACGVDVKANPRYAIMHDKFIVVDGKHVQTGSFNYTFAAAERNAENALVVWNNQPMAMRYQTEFERLFAEASD
ncbi:phospholipase D-like domain-containing protein [Aestuariivirga litoralis]|uniref:phospholipase D-like domain-containing protein n=1 Tax=Aestuariivirga litoralis TaxID=2650924 RepID=UPI0018C7B4DD|nr:phospholipase D-like domain-containing protein [Aestuariivirga litoralis]